MSQAPAQAPALPPVHPEAAAVRDLCASVFSNNWRSGVRGELHFAYTAPSPERYRWQWYWDSCFSAIAWRRLDPPRARAELESLLAAADPDGFIGHTIFWREPVDRVRRLFYNVRSRSDFMTHTIQPPLLAWAWRIAVGDPAAVPAIATHHELIERRRALDGDGLIWIIQPDESGLDASPSFDRVWGWRADGRPGFPLLVRRNRRLAFDPRAVEAAGGPLVCAPATNVLHGLSRLALGWPSITPALVDRLYDERTGLFRQLVRDRAGERYVTTVTWSALAPLALPDLPPEIGHRIVTERLLDPHQFWVPVPPPSVSVAESSFSVRDRALLLRRYWRGPTWINSAWLVWLGMVRLGYVDEAGEMASRLADAVLRSGLREYYNPYTGDGMGAHDFSWSALIMELADPAAGAATSHL